MKNVNYKQKYLELRACHEYHVAVQLHCDPSHGLKMLQQYVGILFSSWLGLARLGSVWLGALNHDGKAPVSLYVGENQSYTFKITVVPKDHQLRSIVDTF